jgi:hypothetical protein
MTSGVPGYEQQQQQQQQQQHGLSRSTTSNGGSVVHDEGGAGIGGAGIGGAGIGGAGIGGGIGSMLPAEQQEVGDDFVELGAGASMGSMGSMGMGSDMELWESHSPVDNSGHDLENHLEQSVGGNEPIEFSSSLGQDFLNLFA